jgi:hypothetical protein
MKGSFNWEILRTFLTLYVPEIFWAFEEDILQEHIWEQN